MPSEIEIDSFFGEYNANKKKKNEGNDYKFIRLRVYYFHPSGNHEMANLILLCSCLGYTGI